MKRPELFFLIILFGVTVGLRFVHLGYSDYIGDEHKAFFQPSGRQSGWDFFMDQRKGPMQFAVSYVPYIFTQDWRNELAERLPFTIFNTAAVFVFYALIKKLTQSWSAAFLGAFLLSVNGFIVGFARIAQYQSLNLFFSFLALYLYSDFLKLSKKLLRNTLLGTAAFALSLLSHWDAVFILPLALTFLASFILNKDISKKEKMHVLVWNIVLGCALLLPFLTPYIFHQLNHAANLEYLSRRVEAGHIDFSRYIFLIKLYNPFVMLEFLIAAGVVSLIFVKRSWQYLLWFAVNFLVFVIFVKKADTHVYNFIVPLITFGAVGLASASQKLPRIIKPLFRGVIAAVLIFLAYQSYVIFVDHKIEYPWQQERVLNFITPKYSLTDGAPLFGFPLSRHWNEINAFVSEQNGLRGENFGYISNEAKTITEWYMDAGVKTAGFYTIGIRRPLSFVSDWKFAHIGRKQVVYEIQKDGEVVVRISRVE